MHRRSQVQGSQVQGSACDESFGSEPFDELRAELLPSTCSGPELAEGSRVVTRPTRQVNQVPQKMSPRPFHVDHNCEEDFKFSRNDFDCHDKGDNSKLYEDQLPLTLPYPPGGEGEGAKRMRL